MISSVKNRIAEDVLKDISYYLYKDHIWDRQITLLSFHFVMKNFQDMIKIIDKWFILKLYRYESDPLRSYESLVVKKNIVYSVRQWYR